MRLWGTWGGGQQGTQSPTLGRQAGVRRQGRQFKAAPAGKARGWGNSWGNMVRFRTGHLNSTRAPHPCHPPLPQQHRAAEIRPDRHGGAGKTLKQQVCPPGSAVCHFGGVPAPVRQTHCQSQGSPPPFFILHPSILFLSPRGWRSAPCPEAGPGAGSGGDRGWKGAKTSCEEGAGGETPPPPTRMAPGPFPAAPRPPLASAPQPLAWTGGLGSSGESMPSVQSPQGWL